MSEFHIEVVQLGAVDKHPNADRLAITMIHGGYPVIVRLGEYKEGDKAVYIPVDSLVDTARPDFAFLAPRTGLNPWYRVRAERMRGVFSMGLLVPLPAGQEDAPVGADMRQVFGVEKWDPPEPSNGAENARDIGILPKYDLEGIRRRPHLLIEGEEVVLHEKIHGQNGRAIWHKGELVIGSHTCYKRIDGGSTWARVAQDMDLETKLRDFPYAIFFEVYGAVQDLTYNVPPGQVKMMVFDVWDPVTRKFLDIDEATRLMADLGIPWVPQLYRGPWSESLNAYAEGPSTLASHVREGFVVRPVREREGRYGRVCLKRHGEGYLTRKEKK